MASGGDAIPFLLTYISVALTILISPWFKLNLTGSLLVLLIGILLLIAGFFITKDIPFRDNENEILIKAIVLPFIVFLASYILVFKKYKKFRKS